MANLTPDILGFQPSVGSTSVCHARRTCTGTGVLLLAVLRRTRTGTVYIFPDICSRTGARGSAAGGISKKRKRGRELLAGVKSSSAVLASYFVHRRPPIFFYMQQAKGERENWVFPAASDQGSFAGQRGGGRLWLCLAGRGGGQKAGSRRNRRWAVCGCAGGKAAGGGQWRRHSPLCRSNQSTTSIPSKHKHGSILARKCFKIFLLRRFPI